MRQEKETTQDCLAARRSSGACPARPSARAAATGHADIAVRPAGISSDCPPGLARSGRLELAACCLLAPFHPTRPRWKQALAELFREYQLLDPMRRAANS